MPEEIRMFNGGMNKDATSLQQPKGTYRSAVNFVQVSKEGNIFALTNERGAALTTTVFPIGFQVMGHTVLDGETFVALAHPSGYSQIGSIDRDGTYTRAVPSVSETDIAANTNGELLLDVTRPVDMVGRKRLAGERLLYFCDGPGGRPLGFINADNPPVIGEIADNTKVVPNQDIPDIFLEEVQEISGNLRVGMYHIIPRYYTEDLTPTTFGVPSNGIPIVNDYRSAGRDSFDGEYPDVGAVNKAIQVRLENVDTSYPFLELTIIRYEGITNTLTIEALPLINITDSTVLYSYSGNEIDVVSLTSEEINQIPISYSSAKAVIQKDSVLFWSNLADNSSKFDAELQRFANDITVGYTVKELEYRPSASEQGAPAGFALDGNPYIDVTSSPTQYIVLEFTEGVNFTASNTVTDYTFYDAGTNASAGITITDAVAIHNGVVGDTVEISDGITPETYTAVIGVPAAFEFDISSGDLIIIATNLVNSINTNSLLVDAGNGTANDSATLALASKILGVVGNGYTVTYTDVTTTGISMTLLEGDTVTTGNPVNMTLGADPLSYTPNEVQLPDSDNLKLIRLFFDPLLQFGGIGIPGGGTLDYTVTSGVGVPTTELGVDVVSTGSGGLNAIIDAGEFNDYKNEALTFSGKGYMRDEVYSLGVLVTFKDGAQSFNYHIPGNDKQAPTTTTATPDAADYFGDRTGVLGTYVSTDNDYPVGQNYPGTAAGDDLTCFSYPANISVAPLDRQVRHHKMPSLIQEPHFRRDGETNYIRLLGLDVTFNSSLSQNLRDQIQSITITRERRNTPQNKSIFGQGLVTRYFNSFTQYPYKWEKGNLGDAEKGPIQGSAVWRKMPFFNNAQISNNLGNENSNSLLTLGSFGGDRSISFEMDTTRHPVGEAREVTELDLFASNQRMAFFSPDTILGTLSPNNVEGTFLTPVLGIQAIVGTDFKASRNVEDDNSVLGIGSSNVSLAKYLQAWTYANYVQEDTTIAVGVPPQITESQYIAKGSSIQLADLEDKIDNGTSSRHLYIRTDASPNFGLSGAIRLDFEAEMDDRNSGLWFSENEHQNNDSLTIGATQSNNLFNLQSLNSGQYGSPGGSVYIPVLTTRVLPSAPGQQLLDVFGGDTFVTKFAYRNNDLLPYKGASSDSTGTVLVGSTTGSGYLDKNASQHDDSPINGMNVKAVGYFFVESTINSEYRHTYIDRSDPNNQVPEPNYFPNQPIEEVWGVNANEGDSRGYNLQYSFENNSRTWSNKQAAQVTVGAFENRTIHSNRAIEDEVADSYRLYAQNSFYDLSKHTGPIWDNFVYNNQLYLHTTKSLWRSYVNDVTHQATSAGQVVLGVGGLFALPAKEVIVSSGGYAGTISQFAGIVTPYAYFFPDVLQGKIFMLQGEALRDISQTGLQQFLHNNMESELVLNNDYVDNPFTGKGFMAGFDFELKRAIFTKVGTANAFTLSYSSLTDVWASEHTYQPNLLYSADNNLYAITNDLTTPGVSTSARYQHNVGDYGVFYDQPVAMSTLTSIFNDAAGVQKVWDNMKIHTVSTNEADGVIQQFDTWNRMRIYSNTQNTSWYKLFPTNAYGTSAVDNPTTEVRVRRNNSKFNLTIPADIVVDATLNRFDTLNQDRTALYKPRMKADHITVDFEYDNSDNYEFIANFIAATFRPNAS